MTPVGISTHPNSSVLTGVTAPSLLVLSSLLAAGCAGDPDLDSRVSNLRAIAVGHDAIERDVRERGVIAGRVIERDVWELAFPGCEDVERIGVRLHAAAGEPLLAVLVSPRGRVLCLDSMSLLAQETSEDPTPTPRIPAGGTLPDPTPTPTTDVRTRSRGPSGSPR